MVIATFGKAFLVTTELKRINLMIIATLVKST